MLKQHNSSPVGITPCVVLQLNTAIHLQKCLVWVTEVIIVAYGAHDIGIDDLSLIELSYTGDQNDPTYKLFRSVCTSKSSFIIISEFNWKASYVV